MNKKGEQCQDGRHDSQRMRRIQRREWTRLNVIKQTEGNGVPSLQILDLEITETDDLLPDRIESNRDVDDQAKLDELLHVLRLGK